MLADRSGLVEFGNILISDPDPDELALAQDPAVHLLLSETLFLLNLVDEGGTLGIGDSSIAGSPSGAR